MDKFQEGIYNKGVGFRDRIFRIFAIILTKLKLKPNHITFSGIVLMIAFAVFTKINSNIAPVFLGFAIFCDGLDGVLARYQNKMSDKGKFVDVVADNLNSTIFAFGIGYGKLANSLYIIPYTYFTILSKILRAIVNSFDYKSDWHFKPVAGFLPNLIAYFGYALFLAFVGFSLTNSIFDYFFVIGSIVLFLDSTKYFLKVVQLKAQK